MSKSGKQSGIQVARAVAAIGILYFHSWTALTRFPEGSGWQIPIWTKWGYLAVDLFFAISGYVICLVAEKPNFAPLGFLIKRIFRLYPLWLVMLTVFAVLALAWRSPLPDETLAAFFWSATLLPSKGFPFYGVGWSLQHEIVFYAIASVAIPLAGIRGLAVVLALFCLTEALFDLPWYAEKLAMRHWEFLAGVLAYLAKDRLVRFGAIGPITVGFVLLCVVIRTLGDAFTPASISPALFLLIVGFANIRRAPEWVEAIGDGTYSIYLIHWIAFLVGSACLSKIIPTPPSWLAEPVRFSLMLSVIALGMASWRYFERPMIALANRLALFATGRTAAGDAPRVLPAIGPPASTGGPLETG